MNGRRNIFKTKFSKKELISGVAKLHPGGGLASARWAAGD